eukprot:RCo020155
MADGYVIGSYVLTIFFLLLFAAYSVYYTYSRMKASKGMSMSHFLAARGTMPGWKIAFSYYASAMGAWAIVSPSSYASYAGLLGLSMYALSTGLPIVIIALLGHWLQRRYPDVVSFSDFVGQRFGWLAQIFVCVVALLNMAIGLLAEYTTMGTIFKTFVGTEPYTVIVLVAVLTTGYTAYGGLEVSIVTDRLQAFASMLLIALLFFYCVATFRHEMPPLSNDLGVGYDIAGYSSIMSMPSSMVAATIYSEAFWSRVWASEDRRALRNGALLGCGSLVVAIFLLGFGGWLACWAGLVDWDTDPNLYLLQVLRDQASGTSSAQVCSWIGVAVVVLAAIMNEGAVDSYQNGLVAAVSGVLLKGRGVGLARGMVLLLNIPVAAVALRGYSILELFLMSNLVTCCCAPPVAMGVYSGPGWKYVTGVGVVLSSLGAIFWLSLYGCLDTTANKADMSFNTGMRYAWINNNYAYDYFLVAVGTSLGGILATMPIAFAVERLCPSLW